MKLRIIRHPLAAILLAIVILLAGSGVVYANGYLNNAQFWTTNLGKIIIFQNDNRITMLIDGYGSWWHAPIDGVLEKNEAVFMDNPLLGEFTLVFDDPTFETKRQDDLIQSGDPDWQLSFCGIRSNVTDELPDGCGFSGKWIIAPNDEFPEGSYLVMKQVAGTVTGSFYDNTDKVFDTITGEVYWGKGWMLLGKTEKRGEVTLDTNPTGTGIGIIYGEMVSVLCGKDIRELVYPTYSASHKIITNKEIHVWKLPCGWLFIPKRFKVSIISGEHTGIWKSSKCLCVHPF